jgi:hypothetical protein
MELEIQSAKLVLSIIDKETGEIITREATLGDFKEVTKKTSTRTKKIKDDGDPTPKIELLENKLQFNKAAIDLTGFEPEQKILVQMEKVGRKFQPKITANERGNRMTKTYTVSFRGQQREALLEYGNIFVVEPTDNENVFKLVGNIEQPEDDIIDVPEEVTNPDELDDLIGDFNF